MPSFGEYFKGKHLPYVGLKEDDNLILKLSGSRMFLAGIRLNGEILHTPGHSDDSITLVLEEGFAFTGDLHPAFMTIDDATTRTSWDKIYRHKIRRIFPGHGS